MVTHSKKMSDSLIAYQTANIMMNSLSQLKSGHPVVDSLIQVIIVSLQKDVESTVRWLVKKIFGSPKKLTFFVMWLIRRSYQRITFREPPPVKVAFTATVLKFTEQCTNNTGYEKFLSAVNEMYRREKRRDVMFVEDKENPEMTTVVPCGDGGIIDFEHPVTGEMFEIHFSLRSQEIELLAERTRKVLQRYIDFKVYDFEGTGNDVLEHFKEFVKNWWEARQTETKYAMKTYTIKKGTSRSETTYKWTAEKKSPGRKLGALALDENMKNDLMKFITNFDGGAERYSDMGAVWKAIIMASGEPGSGKSSLGTALTCHLKRHRYKMDLSIVEDNDALMQLIREIPHENAVLVIDDIDSHCEGTRSREISDEGAGVTDETEEEKSRITLNGVLDFFDGNTVPIDGLLIWITTNRTDLLDDAILRDQRVNKHLVMTSCTNRQVVEYLTQSFSMTEPDYEFIMPDGMRLRGTHIDDFGKEKITNMSAITQTAIHNMYDAEGAWREILEKYYE